jgi:xanthine dehydrogenase accessory factor
MHSTFLTKAQELKDKNQPYATAFIVRREIPSSGKPGDKAIITPSGKIHGWIGGGCTRGIVLKEALEAIRENKPRLVSITPGQDVAAFGNTKTYKMTCQSGGKVEVYIEPVLPNPKLVIFGTSHIAMALAKIAKAMDYRVDVVVDNPDPHVFSGVDTLRALDELPENGIPEDAFVIVCTQGERDLEALHRAIQANPQYLAFVSSLRKANSIFTDLRGLGVTFDQLAKIKTPAGLDLGAKTPDEVAISILAQVIQQHRSEKENVDKEVARQEETALSEEYYINPVCNIPVQKSSAKHVLEYEGEKVYFCCDGCKVSFEKNPEQYMVKS